MEKTLQILIWMSCVSYCCEAQNPTQTIRGQVLDAETREKLPGAHIVLVENQKSTITDVEGKFSIENIPTGRYSIQLSFIGYQPVVIPEILVSSAKEVVLEIKMEIVPSKLDEVVVKPTVRKDRPVNSMASVSARTFSVEEASRYAGALDDPGRMAGNFAGVTTAGVNVNAIVVRGNSPKGLLWRLEGVDIPVPSHFSGSNVTGGGGLTIFSSQLLANSDFYTGAFPAEFGNASAGVFDMKLRNGNNSKKEYAAQVGVQGVEFAAEGPVKTGYDGSYLFNYRYSTMALIFPLLPETKNTNELPIYQDLSFKLNLPTKNAGTFALWGIGGLSKSTMKGFDDRKKWIYPENRVKMNFHYNMGAAGITHSVRTSPKAFVKSSLAFNANQHTYHKMSRLQESNPPQLFPLYNVDITNRAAILSSIISHAATPRISFKTGFNVKRLNYEMVGDALDYQTNILNSLMDGKGNSWLINAHFQGKYNVSPKTSIIAGANISWLEMNKEMRIEPRLSTTWLAAPKHSFSVGHGFHSQTEPLFVYFVTKTDEQTGQVSYPNQNLNRMRAHHFILAYDWSITDNTHLKIEPYFQFLNKIPVVDGTSYSMINFLSDWTFNKALVNQGKGINKGVDFTFERFLKDGYYLMTTASIYKSEYIGGDYVKQHTRYDGAYVLNVLGGKEWEIRKKNLLGMNMKFTFMGPYWYLPVDEMKTQLAEDIIYDETEGFTDRFSNLESITDLTLNYRINRQNVSSVFKLQVRNLIGQQYQGKRYNLKNNTVENHFFTSLVPFVSYKIEF
ncbi:CarboxypepD_reg-like domain-containing protein [Saccharicrinis carchari]|uniref:CarboxypepD_reg-like domain-containing protein n=1 Tax=Saccharicrinis carchari TaxID=1168039 RepID=A0A521F6T5_SACCC|nr:carboxypeptidase-like regulatory domain-containing protein [Saccharicrinis carchari]SMO91928.1 CarboxypepD_reg-like domain-containing protein [Saccharicrinis carchari]